MSGKEARKLKENNREKNPSKMMKKELGMWYPSIMPALERPGPKDHKFEVNLGLRQQDLVSEKNRDNFCFKINSWLFRTLFHPRLCGI